MFALMMVDMRERSKRESVLEYKAKKLARLLEELANEVVIVEGKRDKQALQERIACKQIVLITGKADGVALRLKSRGVEQAVVLTDFDRRGEEHAQRMKEALESHSITPDLQARRTIKFVLGLRFFEEFSAKLSKFEEECSEAKIKAEW